MNLLIIGRGVSGEAAGELARALGWGAELVADGDPEVERIDWSRIDRVVASPGVGERSQLLNLALERGIPVIGELEFGAGHFQGPMLAVTGTNGKTTTTELAAHILRRLYPGEVVEAGNIGTPLSAVAAQWLKAPPEKLPLAVVEVSSFQLERTVDFAPIAAAILNIASDHLDRYHGSQEEYSRTKYRIFARVPEENRIALHGLPGGAAMRWSVDADGTFRHLGRAVFRQDETMLPGSHNRENLLAALELASRMFDGEQLTGAVLREAVTTFRVGRHRLECFAEIGDVVCVDDSKATNPASVVAALKTLDRPARLLLGGLDKEMDFTPIAECADRIARAYVIGRSRPRIIAALEGQVDMVFCSTLEEAAARMVEEARPGEAVLLSPACASMDMFKDYKERGDCFQQACLAAIIRRAGEGKR